jgi:hypothetical protein
MRQASKALIDRRRFIMTRLPGVAFFPEIFPHESGMGELNHTVSGNDKKTQMPDLESMAELSDARV